MTPGPQVLSYQIIQHAGDIIIAYSQPIQWSSFSPDGARNLAKQLLAAADETDQNAAKRSKSS